MRVSSTSPDRLATDKRKFALNGTFLLVVLFTVGIHVCAALPYIPALFSAAFLNESFKQSGALLFGILILFRLALPEMIFGIFVLWRCLYTLLFSPSLSKEIREFSICLALVSFVHQWLFVLWGGFSFEEMSGYYLLGFTFDNLLLFVVFRLMSLVVLSLFVGWLILKKKKCETPVLVSPVTAKKEVSGTPKWMWILKLLPLMFLCALVYIELRHAIFVLGVNADNANPLKWSNLIGGAFSSSFFGVVSILFLWLQLTFLNPKTKMLSKCKWLAVTVTVLACVVALLSSPHFSVLPSSWSHPLLYALQMFASVCVIGYFMTREISRHTETSTE